MYDRPEIRWASDTFWGHIRDALRGMQIAAPDTLVRDGDPWAMWQDPGLVLAQTCGLPFRAHLHDKVALVATPDYDLPGCPPGHYNSVIIARPGPLPHRPRLAINDPLSQSGWAALAAWTVAHDIAFGHVTVTGAHAASARAVADGLADLAAIDAQTWRLLLRHAGADPAFEIARTPPTPGLPLITALAHPPSAVAEAVSQGLARLDPAARAALDLRGIVQIDKAAYLALPLPPDP
ncbi:phosphate/phosphite/phosphonate ABC transporter substrate-binding protein [Roseicyclus sp.]|uniref:phosphate/phosphite/phosphonate ABC transporter substrate-binding protein n=1 Tax=Roseicyclus sp. TaxID=1914329 RepID=UPI003F6ABD15